jgi:hypothetical protein
VQSLLELATTQLVCEHEHAVQVAVGLEAGPLGNSADGDAHHATCVVAAAAAAKFGSMSCRCLLVLKHIRL